MPAALASRDEVLAILATTFRRDGYDGASLATLATATGLGKSSLYHHFPDGKEQMATEVLAALARSLEAGMFAPLADPFVGPSVKLARMLDALAAFYDDGRQACLLERLTASTARARFASPLRAVFAAWIDALARLGREAGLAPATARQRAEDAVVRIEGALVVAAGIGDPKVFTRTLRQIRGSFF